MRLTAVIVPQKPGVEVPDDATVVAFAGLVTGDHTTTGRMAALVVVATPDTKPTKEEGDG